VQRQVRAVGQQLQTLNDIITYVMSRPPPEQTNDTDDEYIIEQLTVVNETLQQLWQDASVHGL